MVVVGIHLAVLAHIVKHVAGEVDVEQSLALLVVGRVDGAFGEVFIYVWPLGVGHILGMRCHYCEQQTDSNRKKSFHSIA